MHKIGCAASTMSILMYFAYILQLMDNMAEQKADVIQPLVDAINAMLWLSYGAFRRPHPETGCLWRKISLELFLGCLRQEHLCSIEYISFKIFLGSAVHP